MVVWLFRYCCSCTECPTHFLLSRPQVSFDAPVIPVVVCVSDFLYDIYVAEGLILSHVAKIFSFECFDDSFC